MLKLYEGKTRRSSTPCGKKKKSTMTSLDCSLSTVNSDSSDVMGLTSVDYFSEQQCWSETELARPLEGSFNDLQFRSEFDLQPSSESLPIYSEKRLLCGSDATTPPSCYSSSDSSLSSFFSKRQELSRTDRDLTKRVTELRVKHEQLRAQFEHLRRRAAELSCSSESEVSLPTFSSDSDSSSSAGFSPYVTAKRSIERRSAETTSSSKPCRVTVHAGKDANFKAIITVAIDTNFTKRPVPPPRRKRAAAKKLAAK